MPAEIKELAGFLNLDDPLEGLAKGMHRDARNVEFTGSVPNRKVSNKAGLVAVANALLPATGINKTILTKYDPINKRIYIFNYNTTGKHGIYCYNTLLGTFQRLIEVGVNTSGDPLAFTPEMLYNINMLYGDSTLGDIIYYLDSDGIPSKINVNRALSGGYGNIQRSFLDVAKEPADIVPLVRYENDSSNTVNNLRKKLFRVKIRWVFDDIDKSITSSQSEMPLPFNAFDQATDADPTKNCSLAIIFQTGPANVKKVEILVANSIGNQMSNFYLVASLDKSAEGISSNDISTYVFRNDKGYSDINTDESDQLQDYVPQVAVAQANLNGNVISYGNITEGYPNLTSFGDGTNSSSISTSSIPYYGSNYYAGFSATQSGMSGFGSGDIHIVVRGIIAALSSSPDTYLVYFTDGSDISYTVSTGDDAAAVIEGLRVDALANGFAVVFVGGNDLIITKASVSLARTNITSGDNFGYNGLFYTSFNAWDWSSRRGFGLVYFDRKGRTNGVVYTNGFSVQTPAFSESGGITYSPIINASIYHLPPDWAYYYQWVRTNDLSKLNYTQWISDRTYKDDIAIAGAVKYAYISIESLNTFVSNNPSSPLAYGFTSGDRIKFIKRYNADSSTANLYGNTRDYEIVASIVNPTINGSVRSGQFLKIILPSTDGTFDFGASGYQNYMMEVYTPATPVANNLNLYYEFGQRYAVGDPTLSTRFHQGMNQNQVYLSQPATFSFQKGDNYIRLRAIQLGNVYSWNIITGSGTGIMRALLGMNFTGSSVTDPNIVAQSVAFANANSFDPSSDTRWFLKSITDPATFKISGTIILNFPTARPSGDSWHIGIQNKSGDFQELAPPFDNTNGGTFTFVLDDYVTIENDNIFLLAASIPGYTRDISVLVSNVTFTIDNVISQRFIDKNYSDYYPSIVNSNGRAWVYEPNAERINYPTMYRWSLPYQEDTSVNQTSRFYPENFDTGNRSFGAIMAMKVNQQQLTLFQERKCCWTGVFQKMITNNTGEQQLVTTNTIITQNNIQPYEGDFGVSNQPTSIVQSGYVYYFVDPVKNKILRLSRDGITDLTETYKVQTWGTQRLPVYLNPGTYSGGAGGRQKVVGVFNVRPDKIGEYLCMIQGSGSLAGETFAFEEKNNAFTGWCDIDCESLVCAENVLYAFKNGVMYRQSALNDYSNYFGVQYPASITLVYNDQVAIKKVFDATGYMSNQVWISNTKGDVVTNHVNPQTLLGQESMIMFDDYDSSENPKNYASYLRDMNSMADQSIALWEGDYLCGEYIKVKYKITTSVFTFFYAPFSVWQLDNRNP